MFWSKKQIKIEAKPSGDPLVCEFYVDRDLLAAEVKEVFCRSREETNGNAFLVALFELPFVREALIRPRSLILGVRSIEHSWREMAPNVGKIIRTFLEQETFLVTKWSPSMSSNNHGHSHDECCGHHEHCEKEEVSPLAQKVQQILNEQINPAVASHGGRITLVKVEKSKVFIRMEGGCQGCAMSSQTLKQGVEKTLCDQLPEIEEVVDVTSHVEGANPYYKE